MKIIYYITDHGLGHASRTVAIVRALQEKGSTVIIRNNDPYSFFKKSLPKTKIIHGQTDFVPVITKTNVMKINDKLTSKCIAKWIKNLPQTIEKESNFVKKEKPDVIVTDISVMPILVSKKNDIKSVAVSNFVWSESLNLERDQTEFLEDAYRKANLIIKLPFGTAIKFTNKKEVGLVARKITESRKTIRKQLKIPSHKKLVTISLGGMKGKYSLNKSDDAVILDISDYSTITKLRQVNSVEGQNIINASDIVVCKCGYGFVSECLSTGTRFRYVLEPTHREAKGIHQDLQRLGLNNIISLQELSKIKLDFEFIKNSGFKKMSPSNNMVAGSILKV